MKKYLRGSVCVLALMASPAWASESHKDQIAKMKKQIEILMNEVNNLKSKQNNNDNLVEEVQNIKTKYNQERDKKDLLAKKVEKLEEKVKSPTLTGLVNLQPAKNDTRGASFETTMNPSPKFSYGDFSWRPFGVLHVDAGFFNDDKFDHPDGMEVRRARLGFQGTVAENIGYVVEADFGNSGSALINAFLSYTGFDNGEIRLGHNRSPYSLEASTNTDDTTFIEFSAPTTAFDVGEIVGVGGHFHGKKWAAGFGLYNQNTALEDTDDEGWRVAGRAAITPIKDKNKVLHFGASAAYITSRNVTNSVTFGTAEENAIQTTNSVQVTIANVDSYNLYGAEVAAVYGPFSVQGEYLITDVDIGSASADANFNGGYIQASYFLTGERRPYVDGNGTFGRVIPKNDFLSGKGWGAWEVAARYSELDLNDGTILGGKMDSYTIGLNWHLNQHTRLMANYIEVDTDENAFSAADDDPSLLLFRGQVIF